MKNPKSFLTQYLGIFLAGSILLFIQEIIVYGAELSQQSPLSEKIDAIKVCNQSVVQIQRSVIGEKDSSLGSGFVFEVKNGKYQIATNAHVVGLLPEDPDKMRSIYFDQDLESASFWVVFQNKEYKANFVGRDPEIDLAILEVASNVPGLAPAPLGNSENIFPGHPVIACGSPYGFANTITDGIISATERMHGLVSYENYLQTQAPINPGNSGGPLVSKITGEVIGINNSGIPRADGLGFSIPINLFKSTFVQIKGTVKRSWFGIKVPKNELRDGEGMRGLMRLDSYVGKNDVNVLQKMRHELFKSAKGGVLVIEVERVIGEAVLRALGARELKMESNENNKEFETPAFKAGILRGDIIKSIGSVVVRNERDLIRTIFMSVPGNKISVRVVRFMENGERKEFTLTVQPILRPPKSARGESY